MIIFLKIWDNPGLFLFIFVHISFQQQIQFEVQQCKLKKEQTRSLRNLTGDDGSVKNERVMIRSHFGVDERNYFVEDRNEIKREKVSIKSNMKT